MSDKLARRPPIGRPPSVGAVVRNSPSASCPAGGRLIVSHSRRCALAVRPRPWGRPGLLHKLLRGCQISIYDYLYDPPPLIEVLILALWPTARAAYRPCSARTVPAKSRAVSAVGRRRDAVAR